MMAMQSYGHSMGHVLLRPSPRPGQNARCDDENGSAGFWRTLAARLFEYFDYTRHGVGVAGGGSAKACPEENLARFAPVTPAPDEPVFPYLAYWNDGMACSASLVAPGSTILPSLCLRRLTGIATWRSPRPRNPPTPIMA
jgi:hypothetical protein